MAYVKLGKTIEGRVSVGDIVGVCPDCGRKLIVKEGRYGKFVACSGFQEGCRRTYNIKTFKIYSQHLCDVINLRKAQYDCDLKMAEHIRDTNEKLNFKACGVCENIYEAMML